nr:MULTISPECIES: sugar phosphate isomerase/epimerase [unclassified Novosphingobium]
MAAGTAPLGQEVCAHDIHRRVECAGRAGYTGMGFWHADLAHLRETIGFAELKSVLASNGIVHIEVEWLNDWYGAGAARAASDANRALLLDAAEALGAGHIKVSDLASEGIGLDQMTEEFATLCAQAAERGTSILFEMLPAAFSSLPSLDQVLSLTRGAGAANGGIMLDNLHIHRTGTPLSDIATKLTPSDLIGVEINDGTWAQPVDFLDSVIHRRLLPGDGELDINGFMQAVWQTGFDGPVGVEVMNEYCRYWDLETTAQVSFRKTSAVLEAARGSAS